LNESLSVFCRADESLNHLSVDEIAVEAVEFIQPEIVTCEVCVRTLIGIESQISEVLHQHEGKVELGGDKIGILRDGSQNLRADPCPKCQIPR